MHTRELWHAQHLRVALEVMPGPAPAWQDRHPDVIEHAALDPLGRPCTMQEVGGTRKSDRYDRCG